jgi:hypothetical protein
MRHDSVRYCTRFKFCAAIADQALGVKRLAARLGDCTSAQLQQALLFYSTKQLNIIYC